ncbi:MAG: hypothetical protein O7E57_13190 [Gammaproteobacteria bacterium]|nr:hypothetical protein [Gammaproteobacteria bacterium]
MGNNFGQANDKAVQLSILRTALSLVETAEEGGTLVDMPTSWPDFFEFTPGGKNSMG